MRAEGHMAMPSSKHSFIILVAVVAALAVPRAQTPSAFEDQLRRVFQANEYAGERFGPVEWMPTGAAYGALEHSGSNGKPELVAYDAASGAREVLADSAALTPA